MSSTDSGVSSAPCDGDEVGDLAFYFRSCRPVVVTPARFGLSGFGLLQDVFFGVDADRTTSRRCGALGTQWARRAALCEIGSSATIGRAADRHLVPGRTADRASVEIDREGVFAEPSATTFRRSHFGQRREPCPGEIIDGVRRRIRRVAHHHRLGLVVGMVGEQLGDDVGIMDVRRGDNDVVDQSESGSTDRCAL